MLSSPSTPVTVRMYACMAMALRGAKTIGAPVDVLCDPADLSQRIQEDFTGWPPAALAKPHALEAAPVAPSTVGRPHLLPARHHDQRRMTPAQLRVINSAITHGKVYVAC
ncbi:hypothetical protein KMM349_10280 [Stenotrophomonas maltophilia]|nr:hypothetical protein KMM349_10280 [Stenotrophomonas maltophilia]